MPLPNIVNIADADYLADRPLPTAPDGRYEGETSATTDASGDNYHGKLYKLIQEVQTASKQGAPIEDPAGFAKALLDLLEHPDAINDREGVFTQGLALICKLPQDLDIVTKLNNSVITMLYNSLPHPPATYIGTDYTPSSVPAPPSTSGTASAVPRIGFAYRRADGSGNNPNMPHLGKSETPYARDVESKHPLPKNVLPDSGMVFDALLKARDWQPHPGRNSSLTFGFASLVTHSLFRTDPRDSTKNNTTSYLDLSVLYGTNQATQDSVRNKAAGRGLLWPDAFAEDRLILVPPAASALLVIFSRNHNYVAEMILKLNERGRWTDPPPEDPVKRALQDEEIFQTARNVNCGHFMAMIFGDYVAGFLGLARDGSSWSMNPFDPIKKEDGSFLGRGEGNHCSVEFNLMYRWHAVTAQHDVKWTEDLFNGIFGGKPFDQITLADFGPAVVRAWTMVDPNPRTRTFNNMKRGPDGSFADEDIAKILLDATEWTAGAYRARGCPEVLRIVEILGIEQARAWGCCTMNEFRAFLGLKQFESFEEWNSNPAVAKAASQLYGHIDNLELYVGLQAEDCMPLGPGSGICCGYTMTRAILGDAVGLVRGDRFYTTDYTPANLTTWGFQDCARDPDNGSFGSALPRLLLRHLPEYYTPNNTYGMFPFFTPEIMKQNLTKLGLADQYTYSRPQSAPKTKIVKTGAGVRRVLGDPKTFVTPYGDYMRTLTGGRGFFTAYDAKTSFTQDKAVIYQALFPESSSITQVAQWYRQKTTELIKEHSFQIDGIPGTRVDIVGNVINLVSVHWIVDFLAGLDLKTEAHPKGLFTEQELYDQLTILYNYVFLNTKPEHGFELQQQASRFAKVLSELIEKSLNEAVPHTLSHTVTSIVQKVTHSHKPNHPFLHRLAQTGRPTKDIVADVLGLAITSSVSLSKVVAQVVDFYLDSDRVKERSEIVTLASKTDEASTSLLRGYIREAQRLRPEFAGLLRNVVGTDDIPTGGSAPLHVQNGDMVYVSIKDANLNPTDFPNPTTVDPRRPAANYALQDITSLGAEFADQVVPEMIRVIFGLKNLRRSTGAAGILASITVHEYETDSVMYVDASGNVTAWPGSLQVVYDN